MSLALQPCPGCAFENPRPWRMCARCGRSLVSSVGEPQSGDTDVTRTDASPLGATLEASTPDGPDLADEEGPTLRGGQGFAAASGDVESPLIGQTDAAQAIRTGVERAFTVGTPTLLALEGPRGSGKTRLLVYASEVAARMAPDVRIFYASCREGGSDGSYAPFSRLLLDRFGVTPSTSPSVVRGQMATTVGNALGTTNAIEIAETTHLLGHIAGIPFPDSPFLSRLQDKPEELHHHACVAFRRLFEGEAQQRPVLVLLDNMHHAEDDAWDVLSNLSGAEAHLAVALAGDAPITERAETLEPSGGCAVGPIKPLREDEVASMIQVLLPQLSSVPEPLVAAVAHRSGGNPSAVRELVFALQEAGLFVGDEQTGLIVDLGRLESGEGLPVTPQDAIRARLGRLDEFERATLERAAVQGERFWDGAILGQMRAERDAPGDDTDPLSIWPDDSDAEALLGALARLEHKGFIEANDQSDMPGAAEYTFFVARTRELLYEEIDEELRTLRHGAVARWLGLVAELRREGIAATIAPHLEKAGQTARAGRAYLEAAGYEKAQLRTGRALQHIEKALALMPDEDVVRKVHALHEHGSLLTTLGRYDEAIVAFTDMLRAAWSVGARGKGGAALNRLARVHRQRGEDEQARTYLVRALELFRAADDLRGVASSLDDLAQVHRLQGELDEALHAASEALDIRRAYGDPRGEALSLHTIGTVELARGNLDVAEQMFRQALDLRRQAGDREGLLQSQNALGILAHERGDRATAVGSWRAALDQAREMADRRSECFLLNNMGEALCGEGDLEAGKEHLLRARELAHELGDRRAMAEVERNLGLAALRKGDDDAEERLKNAKELAKDYGSTEYIALAQRALGALYAQTLFDADGEPDRRAEETYLTSIDMFRDIGNEKEAARSLAELGQHLIERGDLETAKERLREARAIMRRMGLAELERVDRTLAELG